MKILIDHSLCQGHGQCEEVAPALFRVGDDGLATGLKDVETAAEETLARESARRCPADAITLTGALDG
jgi:ferredoxin